MVIITNRLKPDELLFNHVRANVILRDNEQCFNKMCRSKRKLTVHHIKARRFDKSRICDEGNMVTLCKKCHRKVEIGELILDFTEIKEQYTTKKQGMEIKI